VAIAERNIVDLPQIAEWTGIDYKSLSQWANKRRKLPSVGARLKRGKVFDWAHVRPILAELSADHPDRIDPSEWPR